ncbi:MAG TPA: TetR/AcrR family transcriptional regulator [Chloroflexota bacterium]|nr:TetR/AcrR family transcriptional regulator [Chloroflexota bacterium]
MTNQHRQRDVDTATQILDVAERLAQSRGFNGFSYADVAAELRLTKAALHYHFAGKAEMGEALINRYSHRFAAALDALDAHAISAPAKLEGYANLYLDVLRDKRMCLCGMFAAEYQTLPQRMRDAVIQFFDSSEAWLQRVVDQGQQEGTLYLVESSKETARAIVGGLEGAMLVARPYGDVSRFQAATTHLLAGLIAGPIANAERTDGSRPPRSPRSRQAD